MYVPTHFTETNPEVLHQLIREHPLGTLVTVGAAGIVGNHLPFVLDVQQSQLVLQGHVAKANTVWSESNFDIEALIIFQGPSAYVSPNWYAAKAEHGKVVPTYNYVTVHAYGKVKPIHDIAWLRQHLATLTRSFESGQAVPWKMSDAPQEFIEKLLASIVGIEVNVSRLVGKWKLSQNRDRADRDGVARALTAKSDSQSLAMAELVIQQNAKTPP